MLNHYDSECGNCKKRREEYLIQDLGKLLQLLRVLQWYRSLVDDVLPESKYKYNWTVSHYNISIDLHLVADNPVE